MNQMRAQLQRQVLNFFKILPPGCATSEPQLSTLQEEKFQAERFAARLFLHDDEFASLELQFSRSPNVSISQKFHGLCLEGLQFYHTYDRWVLVSALLVGLLFWDIGLVSYLGNSRAVRLNRVALVVCGLLMVFFWVTLQNLPWIHALILAFPLLSLWLNEHRVRASWLKRAPLRRFLAIALEPTIWLVALTLVFHNRAILSALWIFRAVLAWRQHNKNDRWTVCCCVLAIFPCLPTDYGLYNRKV
jgi:hypothetical protein